MIPCPSCRRHLRPQSVVCPFCSTRITTVPAAGPLLIAVALASFGCSSKDDDGTDEAETSSESSESEGSDSSSETADGEGSTSETDSTDTGTDTTESTDSEGGSFYAGPSPDLGPDTVEREVLLDGPQYPDAPHPVRYRLPK